MNPLNGLFGRIAPGLCRLSMDGSIAIRTSGGYRTYDPARNRLTNCDSFVFDAGEEFFFVVPTNRARPGDVLLVNGKPRCVIRTENGMLTVINYEDSTVENVLPERHMFMGNAYFYGKIVSMLGAMTKGGGKTGGLLKYMMLSQLMKGGGMNALLPLMLMGKGGPDGLFDLDDDLEDDGNSDDKTDKEA